MLRSTCSISLVFLLAGCATLRGPVPPRPGAIDPVAEAVLSAGWLETPLALDNGRLVAIEAYALATVRGCGERLEALAGKADQELAAPVGASVALLVAGLSFGAATGLLGLAPDGPDKDRAIGAVSVIGTTVLGVTAAASIASAVSADGSAARRTGEITVALQAFAEDWQEVLADPSHACVLAGEASATAPSFRAPYSLLQAEAGPGARCLDRPQRDTDGAYWTRRAAWDVHGAELNAPRCILGTPGQVTLERALRTRVARLDRRCLAPLDRLPATPPSEEPATSACP